METKKIEEIIRKSLIELAKITNEEEKSKKEQQSKLIFPKYSSGEKRVSEQEARFLFIEQVVKDYDGFYSVETPTNHKYQFSEGGKKVKPPKISTSEGKSGSVDVCLYDNNKIKKHLIEFKATISKQSEINKDFLKLKYDNDKKNKLSNYFVHVLNSYDNNTIKGLKNRYKEAFELKEKYLENDITVFVCMLDIPKSYQCDKNIISFNSKNYEEELEKYLNKK